MLRGVLYEQGDDGMPNIINYSYLVQSMFGGTKAI